MSCSSCQSRLLETLWGFIIDVLRHLCPVWWTAIHEDRTALQSSLSVQVDKIHGMLIFVVLLILYTPMLFALYLVLTRVLWKQHHRHYYSGGIRTHDLCNSRAVSSYHAIIDYSLIRSTHFLFSLCSCWAPLENSVSLRGFPRVKNK